MSYRVIIATLVLTALACTPPPSTDPLRATLSTGIVEGSESQTTETRTWKAIPFAQPPVGQLRWRAPEPPDGWEGVRPATEETPACTQLDIDAGWRALPRVVGQEDCLYLDVYRPATDETGLPVYVWIHGGGNAFGQISPYVLENLAKKANLVAVAIQYRMNVFGYFTHPALREGREAAEASGNFGLLDQIAALEWVRDNIAAFGGDRANVTIAGESAGGHNVMALMLSPLAKELFHRAVMQSGGMVSQTVATIDATADRTIETARTMRGLNPDDVMGQGQLAELLYDLSDTELLQAHAGGPEGTFVPAGNVIEDGVVIPGNLLCTIESGNYNRVPLIAGATADEMGSLGPILPPFQDLLEVIGGNKTLNEALPTEAARHTWLKFRDYGSRFWRAIMVDELLARVAMHQSDLYAYSFDWGHQEVFPEAQELIYGAGHAIEIPLFHGNVDAEGVKEWWIYSGFGDSNRGGRQALSDAMVAYLGEFVRTGNPNAPGTDLPEWEPWSPAADAPKVLHLDATPAAARIGMEADRLSVVDIRRALDSEPADLQELLRATLGMIQPYATYEPGDYEYGSCD